MNYKRNQEELLNSFICPLLSLLAEHNLSLSFWLVCLTSSSGHSGRKVYFPVFLFVSDSCDASIMNDVCMMHVTNWERTSGRKAKFLEKDKEEEFYEYKLSNSFTCALLSSLATEHNLSLSSSSSSSSSYSMN